MADAQADTSVIPGPNQQARHLCGDLSYERHPLIGNATDGWHVSGKTDFGDGNIGTCGGRGSESIIKFTAPTSGVYTVQAVTETGTLPVVYMRKTCESDDTETLCIASLPQANKATFSFSSEEREEWFIFVDTWQPSGRVNFNLTITYADAQEAPVINSASMLRTDTTLEVKLAAVDINADIAEGRIFDESGSTVFEFPFYFEEAQPANRQQVRTFNFETPSRGTEQLYVTLSDLTGLESESARLEDGLVINANNGDPCGESVEDFTRCPTGSQCSPIGRYLAECVASAPPSIESFRVFRVNQGHQSEVTYSDNNADAVFGIIELTDDNNTVLEIHAFPLDTLNDEMVQSFELPPQSDTLPSRARLILSDALGQDSNTAEQMIEFPEILGSGAPCDPADIATQCIDTDRCLESCGDDGSPCSRRCINKELPTVTNAVVIRNLEREQLYLELHINDTQRIFGGVQFNSSATDTPIEIELTHWIRSGDTRLSTITKRPLPPQLRDIAAVTVLPIGLDGSIGEAVEISIESPAIIEAGNLCDPEDIRRTCDVGQACIETNQNMACAASTASVIQDATLYVDSNQMIQGISTDVVSGDAEVSTLLIRYSSLTDGSVYTRAFPLISPVPPQSTLTIQQRVNVLTNTSIEAIALQDVRYVRSAWQTVVSTEPPILNANTLCPSDQLFGKCVDGTTCSPDTNGVYQCRENTVGCPDPWTINPLIYANGTATSQGDTRVGYNTELGSCNLGDKGVIHEFTPMIDALYTIKVVPNGISPIRYPRIAIFGECGLTETELSCTQSGSAVYNGRADTSVFIIVSAPPIGDDFHGTYEIEIAPHRAADIESAVLIDSAT
ncbi:MAG: hypothetical protein ACPGQS_14165, partial [Bradymonadia bacterium]